jgi:hypothetical protein
MENFNFRAAFSIHQDRLTKPLPQKSQELSVARDAFLSNMLRMTSSIDLLPQLVHLGTEWGIAIPQVFEDMKQGASIGSVNMRAAIRPSNDEKRDMESCFVGMQPEKGKRAGARHTWRQAHLRKDVLTVPNTNRLWAPSHASSPRLHCPRRHPTSRQWINEAEFFQTKSGMRKGLSTSGHECRCLSSSEGRNRYQGEGGDLNLITRLKRG